MPEGPADRLAALLVVAMAAIGVHGLVELPTGAPIAIHFNAAGQVDGWTRSRWALFAMPGLALGLWALFSVLPRMDTRADNLARSRPALDVIAVATLAVLGFAQVMIVATSLGTLRWPSNAWLFALGALFVVTGNVLGKLRPNHTVGIRTPWTLAHDRVWDQTHRYGGKVFVAAGLVLALTPAVPFARGFEGPIVAGVSLLAAAAPVWKSYRLSRTPPVPPGGDHA
jgi:uncharacterized membrane protein